MKYLIYTLLFTALIACSSGTKKEKVTQVPDGESAESAETPVAPSYTDSGAPVEEVADGKAKIAVTPSATPSTAKLSETELSEKTKLLYKAIRSKNDAEVAKISAEILSSNPDDPGTLNAISTYYYNQGRFEMSRLILQRALKRNANLPALRNNLGVLNQAEGEEADAISEYKLALRNDPNNASAAANLSAIHMKYKNYKAALPLLEIAYNAKAAELRSGTNYAIALQKTGSLELAQQVYEKITTSYQSDYIAPLNYAMFLVENNQDLEKAEKLIGKVKFLSTDMEINRVANQLSSKLAAMKSKKK